MLSRGCFLGDVGANNPDERAARLTLKIPVELNLRIRNLQLDVDRTLRFSEMELGINTEAPIAANRLGWYLGTRIANSTDGSRVQLSNGR